MSLQKKLSIAAIFFTFFIDALSWSIVFPIFAPLFLDSANHWFSAETSLATRTTLLGCFLAVFSLGQFLGAPILGEYADQRGRKKALCISIFFTLIGFALTAWSIHSQNLYGLFTGRLITGLFASNMAICLASITDLCKEETDKVTQFGHLSAISGGAFVLGAFLGGKLSDPSIHPFFTPALPFWIATTLTLGNLLFVLLAFRETSPSKQKLQFHLLRYFLNIKAALKTKSIKSIYSIYFLFLFSWTILLQFTPVLVVQNFDFTNSNIADLALFMGGCWALGSSYLNKILSNYFSTLQVLEGCLVGFTLLCALLVFQTTIYGTLAVLAGCVILGGLAWPVCTHMISSAGSSNMQGKILGMSQSVQSAAMALAPPIAGFAYHAFAGLPFLLGAAASCIAGGIYLSVRERK